MTMTALFDHHTIKRLSAEATVRPAASHAVEPPPPASKASHLACLWYKNVPGRLACTWIWRRP
jgi:hypothetical protein